MFRVNDLAPSVAMVRWLLQLERLQPSPRKAPLRQSQAAAVWEQWVRGALTPTAVDAKPVRCLPVHEKVVIMCVCAPQKLTHE